MAQLRLMHRKWFGDAPITDQTLGEALFLETDHWEKTKVAVANGISEAFK